MLMSIFKTYKEDILIVSNLLYAIARGWKEVSTSPKEKSKQEALSAMLGSIEKGLLEMA
jgi:hypothetical protein